MLMKMRMQSISKRLVKMTCIKEFSKKEVDNMSHETHYEVWENMTKEISL